MVRTQLKNAFGPTCRGRINTPADALPFVYGEAGNLNQNPIFEKGSN
jgi:hypothetical protein